MPKQPQDHKKKKSKQVDVTPKYGLGDVTPASAWKKNTTETEPHALEVPSGNICLVRPVGMQAFLAEGLIPNSLLGIITSALEQGEKGEEVDEEAVVEGLIDGIRDDPAQLVDMIKMADACTLYCVIQPEVLPTPAAGETRFADKLYVDEVDIDDKLFIMNYAVGGTRDLEPFRAAVAPNLADVPAGEGVAEDAE